MGERYQEGGDDRQGQQRVRDGDDVEGDERSPDQIEKRRRDRNAFGPEPVEPADREFPFLMPVEPARARQEPPPVLFHDLHGAAGPARSLRLEG